MLSSTMTRSSTVSSTSNMSFEGELLTGGGRNSCSLTWSVNRGRARTASGLILLAAPLDVPQSENSATKSDKPRPLGEANAKSSLKSNGGEDAPVLDASKPVLQVNGETADLLRSTSSSRSDLMRSSGSAPSSSSLVERARASWGGLAKKADKTNSPTSMSDELQRSISSSSDLLPEGTAAAHAAAKKISYSVDRPSSWTESADLSQLTPEERQSCLDNALATILSLPETRDAIRRSMTTQKAWSALDAKSPERQSPVKAPFELYSAANVDSILGIDSDKAISLEELMKSAVSSLERGRHNHADTFRSSNSPSSGPASPNGGVFRESSSPNSLQLPHAHHDNRGWGRSWSSDRMRSWDNRKALLEVNDGPQASFGIRRCVSDVTGAQEGPKEHCMWQRAAMEQRPWSSAASRSPARTYEKPKIQFIEISAKDDEATFELAKKVRQPRGKGRTKFNLQIFVPESIAEHKHYRASKYLIGDGGCNMKAIHEKFGAKLRMRGINSGFKEKNDKEADAPLHLSIAAENQTQLDETKALVIPLFEKMIANYVYKTAASTKEPFTVMQLQG